MLEIIVLIYGIVTMVRGKFPLSGRRELLGWRARVCGGILLGHLVLAVGAGLIIGLTGTQTPGLLFGVSIASLITVIVISQIVGSSLYKGQRAEATFAMSAASQPPPPHNLQSPSAPPPPPPPPPPIASDDPHSSSGRP